MRSMRGGLACALVLCLGAVSVAVAGYIDRPRWSAMPYEGRLMYVAGVADTLEAVQEMVEAAGPERTAQAVQWADACTTTLRLGEAVTLAERALRTGPSDLTPAEVIVLAFARCGVQGPRAHEGHLTGQE